MDATQIVISVITVVGVISGSGIIQFFVNRRDNKKEAVRAQAFETLREEFRNGLQAREDKGRERYEQHSQDIKKMQLQHEQDFKELKQAVQQLTDNDSKITNNMDQLKETQAAIAESLVGMAHDRIIQRTDKISERGSITNKEKATLKSMYDPYHRLGGNGEVREAFEYVLTLPVVSEDQAREKDRELRCAELQSYCKSV